MLPRPFLILETDPDASCSDIVRVRALMNAGYCRDNWACGEGGGPWQSVMFSPGANTSSELEDVADNLEEAADNAAMDASTYQPD